MIIQEKLPELSQQRKKKLVSLLQIAIKSTLPGQSLINLNLYNTQMQKISFQYLINKIIQAKYKVKSLNISQNTLGSPSCCYYFNNAIFEELRNLDLTLNFIKDQACQQLGTMQWNNLKTLNLSSNAITAAGISSIVKIKSFFNLRILNINNNDLRNEGLQLFSKKQFNHLQELYLINNKITEEGIHYLIQTKFPKLKTLSLGKNKISNKGCQQLVKILLPSLQLLHINDNQITAQGIAYLKKGEWPNLTLVYLARNRIGDQGCRHIIQAKWKKLNWLCLSECEIGDVGLKWISKANWPQLKTLRLSKNYLQIRGFRSFSKAYFPKLQILLLQLDRCPGQVNKELIKMGFKHIKKLKLYETNRYYSYQYRNITPKYVQDKQFWNEMFPKAYPQIEL